MTLTRSSRNIFCSGERRVLSPCELLVGQGFPDCGVDAAGEFVRGSHLDGLSDTTLISLAGNAMCAACVGPILWWVSQHAFPRVLVTNVDAQTGPCAAVPGVPLVPCEPVPCEPAPGEPVLGDADVEGVAMSNDSETQTGSDQIPALIDDFVSALENRIDFTRPEVAASLRASDGGPVGSERVRDLYPLPAIPLRGFSLVGSRGKHWDDHAILVITKLANASLGALSILAGFKLGAPAVAKVEVQRAVQERALGKAERMCRRLCGVTLDNTPRHCFATLVDDAVFLERPPNPPLNAEGCDLLKRSACVDPLPFISPEHAAIVSDPKIMFDDLAPDTVVTGRLNRGDREEYAKLVVRQLRSGKVGIGDSVFASETIFAVGKSNGALAGRSPSRALWLAARPLWLAGRPGALAGGPAGRIGWPAGRALWLAGRPGALGAYGLGPLIRACAEIGNPLQTGAILSPV